MYKTEIKLTDSQFDFITSDSKFTAFVGGYKSGKTYIKIRKGIDCLARTHQDGLLAEPNYTMNEELIKPEIETYMNNVGISFKFYGQPKNWYVTNFGKILLRTQNERSSLEGHNLGWFGLDEVDLFNEEKASENWRILISKLTLPSIVEGYKGMTFGFIVGTAEGFKFVFNKFYKEALEILSQSFVSKDGYDYTRKIYERDKYKLFISSVMENENNLTPDFIETMYNDYDARFIDRYIHGKFISITYGHVYYNFSKKNIEYVPFDTNAITHMSWDVNFSDKPMCTSLIQELTPQQVYGDQIPDYINPDKILYATTKHFANEGTNTEEQCLQIKTYLDNSGFVGKLDIYGDRVGSDRRVGADRTHYQIVADIFDPSYKVGQPLHFGTRKTLSIVGRISCVNRMLLDSNGKRHIIISSGDKSLREDRGLRMLIEDYEQCSWTPSGNKLDDSSLGRTDPTDAESYYYYNEHDSTRLVPKFY